MHPSFYDELEKIAKSKESSYTLDDPKLSRDDLPKESSWMDMGPDPAPNKTWHPPGKLKRSSGGDIDDLESKPARRLMPALKAIHKLGMAKEAEPPPPRGVSVKEWDKILQDGIGDRGTSRELAKKYADMIRAAAGVEKRGYKLQGHTDVQGLRVAIENRRGSVRKGKDKDGKEWRTKMLAHYGYFVGTKTKADGEPLDVYVGPKKDEVDHVYVVHQKRKDTGEYDEDKVMAGFKTKREAKAAFLKHYNSRKFLGPISKVTIDRLRELIASKKALAKVTE